MISNNSRRVHRVDTRFGLPTHTKPRRIKSHDAVGYFCAGLLVWLVLMLVSGSLG